MDKLLELFNEEVRKNPRPTPGLAVVRDAYHTRLEGAYNYICSWTVAEHEASKAVKALAEHFRQKGEQLLWRVYDYDGPAKLETCLQQEGFIPSPQGTLMVLPLNRELKDMEHNVRRVASASALEGYLSVPASVFGDSNAGDFDYHLQLLSDPNSALFAGYDGNEPVASARLDIPSNASFGQLFGGCVLPKNRGQGFYRALVWARAQLARERGLTYLSTEARETSRPILETLGFIPMARETTWVLPAD